MKLIILIISVLMSVSAFAEQAVKCELTYFGGNDKFKVTEFSFMGIPSDAYLYTCKNCGNIQIDVFPSFQSANSYSFRSSDDFVQKISSAYTQKDIAKLEMSGVTQGGKIKYSITDTGVAEFYPINEKQTYLFFTAKQNNDDLVGYTGFVTSNGAKSCTIIASYIGSEISNQGRESLSYFINHVSL
ncbi:hypothetical protein SJZ84_13000 [Hafnia paralvei]|uniref:hypothetical protein n=1 Tax=Hafnia paralvei TaxID=546367 RepID=UPI0029DA5BA3|nr:hypothetical protein [Hafnia paralvei]MDX6911743.1 hypothetical protein [Hafnia paralvei]